MKKPEKGNPGYYTYKRKSECVKTGIMFSIVLLILCIGFLITETRLNVFTVLAVLCVLPAGKGFVGVVMYYIHDPRNELLYEQMSQMTLTYPVINELVFTSKDKTMEIDCIVITDSTVLGYTSNLKVDHAYIESFLVTMLQNDNIEANVIMLTDRNIFLDKMECLNSEVFQEKQNEFLQQQIKRTLLAISL